MSHDLPEGYELVAFYCMWAQTLQIRADLHPEVLTEQAFPSASMKGDSTTKKVVASNNQFMRMQLCTCTLWKLNHNFQAEG